MEAHTNGPWLCKISFSGNSLNEQAAACYSSDEFILGTHYKMVKGSATVTRGTVRYESTAKKPVLLETFMSAPLWTLPHCQP